MAEARAQRATAIDVFEILPKIVEQRGSTVVIKYGGSAMLDPVLKRSVVRDIVFLQLTGLRPIVVHGGGPAINEHMARLGLEPEFVDGQRKTDAQTLEVVEMVLCGKVQNELVKLINLEGVSAAGLSGKDVGLIEAKKHRHRVRRGGELHEVDLGQVGDVAHIEPRIIDVLTENEVIPVIAPIGVGADDQDYNINADVLAGELASALHAQRLVYLTDVDGILRDPADPSTRIPVLDVATAEREIGASISGGMIPKVESCLGALRKGLGQGHIINGTRRHALLSALLTDEGCGTTISAARAVAG